MTTDGGTLPGPALCRLLTWLSPGFPVGGYSYSHGIEQAVEVGLVGDRDTLGRWIAAILAYGTARIDGAVLAAAWSATAADDAAALARVSEIAALHRGTAETAAETVAQGRAFLAAVRGGWPHPRLEAWAAGLRAAAVAPSYPVAVGVAAALAAVPLAAVVAAYLHAFAANLVSAGVRLVPLGQSDGLAVLAGLEAMVLAAGEAALAADLADLGTATVMVDWTSIRHETQYTRLFRS